MIAIAGLNLLSAGVIGKAEDWIVGLKVAILLVFVGVGFAGIDASQLRRVHGRRRCSWRRAG